MLPSLAAVYAPGMAYLPDARGAGRVSPLFDSHEPWQMSFGERSALTGLLSAMRPALAVEIGTAEGGSLRQVAAHSEEVHSFDLVEPHASIRELENVTLHVGDSHRLLPEALAAFAAEGRNVDFALVDGDHSADGVAQDMRDLLDSDAVGRTVILMHDSFNPEVRRGLSAVDWDAWPKVLHAHLDFLTGYRFGPPLDDEMWSGLAAVVVDAGNPRKPGQTSLQQGYRDSFDVFLRAAEADARIAGLEAQLVRAGQVNGDLTSSLSWQLTEPLRGLKRRLGR